MLKKLSGIALLLLGLMVLISVSNPLFLMVRENQIHSKLELAYPLKQLANKSEPLHVLGNSIKINEETTGDRSNVELFVNRVQLSKMEEIQLNGTPEDPYYSWIRIMKVRDRNVLGRV